MKEMFDKYEKQSSESRVLMMWLLLNNCNLERVRLLEEAEESRSFGLKIKKVYGLTEDHIDTDKISKELARIQCPTICSVDSYEYHADSPYIYVYKRRDDNLPLVINDMGVVSKTMVIGDDLVISDNFADDFMSRDCISGFPYFKEYALRNEFKLGKWTVSFLNNIFTVQYEKEVLYNAIEIDKTSTYKIVIYLIQKAAVNEEVESDNFICEKYRRKAAG